VNNIVVILNVDDNESARYNKTRMLRQAGFSVVEAQNGAEALRLLETNPPQLAVLDVQLPDMNGIALCAQIKNHPHTRGIPVVQVSATFVTERDREVGLEGGAEIYLTEPLEPHELVTAVRVLLRLRHTEREREVAFQCEHQARLQAEEATRLKDEFLANLSHELRTPMNTITGWTHLLRTGKLDATQGARALESIERAARAQAQLIEDLLDISRIVSGKLHLALQSIELRQMIETAVESQRPIAQAKGVGLSVKPSGETLMVFGDAGRLQQVLLNLLSNAVKFTPSGGQVELAVERNGDRVRARVTDSGEGIAPEFLPYVFERFRQADAGGPRKQMGLGLGLAITKHIVELHGGTITASSEGKGQGSTFIVELPIAPVSAAWAREPAPSSN
jgi:two-component system, sensor histidine kinase